MIFVILFNTWLERVIHKHLSFLTSEFWQMLHLGKTFLASSSQPWTFLQTVPHQFRLQCCSAFQPPWTWSLQDGRLQPDDTAPSVWQCSTSNGELGDPSGRDTAPPIQPSLGKTFLSQTIIYGQMIISKTERNKDDFIRIRSCSNNSLSSRFYQEAPAPQLQTIQWPERFLTNWPFLTWRYVLIVSIFHNLEVCADRFWIYSNLEVGADGFSHWQHGDGESNF